MGRTQIGVSLRAAHERTGVGVAEGLGAPLSDVGEELVAGHSRVGVAGEVRGDLPDRCRSTTATATTVASSTTSTPMISARADVCATVCWATHRLRGLGVEPLAGCRRRSAARVVGGRRLTTASRPSSGIAQGPPQGRGTSRQAPGISGLPEQRT